MRKLSLLICIVFFCSLIEGSIVASKAYRRSTITKDFPAKWFTQKLDHFNGEEFRHFKQRYYENGNYYKVGGPILLYINGEGPVSNPPYLPTDEVVLLAQQFNAMIVTLEHRYYGLSVPFELLTTENLQWLSSRQALNDLAHFVLHYRKELEHNTNATGTKIFTIGCSYSGALSAWFRLKYPHVTVGSISSSGVVHAILDFTAFDKQIPASVGDECAHVLRETTHQLENLVLYNENTKLPTKQKFHAEMVTEDGDFFFLMADIMATSVQYGYQDDLCIPLVKSYNSNGSSKLVDVFANFTVSFWNGLLGTPEEYATSFQQDITVNENKADRQWFYQCCTEFGWWQNAPAEGSIRSHVVNMTYHHNRCRAVFEMDLWPDVDATNEYYGGANIAATKVFYANGSQDPWKHASITHTLNNDEPAKVINCHNCCHCVDVRTCPGGCDSPNDLDKTRSLIASYVTDWLLN